MKTKVLSLVLLFAVVLSVPVFAAGPERMPRVQANISFSGTSATCTASARADNARDSVVLVAKLWHGNTCLSVWTATGTQSAQLQKTKSVTRGETYKLTLDVTINGVSQPTRTVTRTCP